MDDLLLIESQLEEQLSEQRASCLSIEGALNEDSENQELIQIRHELFDAIQATEESLLRMKQDRLLRYMDENSGSLSECNNGSNTRPHLIEEFPLPDIQVTSKTIPAGNPSTSCVSNSPLESNSLFQSDEECNDEVEEEDEYEDDDLDEEDMEEYEERMKDADERNFASSWFEQIETMASIGVQTETENFADWEKHTRGIASKMMFGMGFKVGLGLGSESQGITEPVTVRFLNGKQSLDCLFEEKVEGEQGEKRIKKRKGRGGERRRRQKIAKALKEQKEEERKEDEMRGAVDVFDFINTKLIGSGMEKRNKEKENLNSEEKGKRRKEKGASERKDLVMRNDVIIELNGKIKKLEDMAKRNSNDKNVVFAVKKKIEEVNKEMKRMKNQHDMAKNVIDEKNMHKKWTKF